MINLIWDLDGTLFNTYPFIVNRIQKALSSFNLSYSYDEIYEHLIKTTTFDFLLFIEKKHNIGVGLLLNAIKKIDLDYSNVELMPHVKEFLDINQDLNKVRHFIYTHRDHKTCNFLLCFLEIDDFFVEVVDEGNVHFVRKPDPESINYLIKTYSMDKNNTYYIGDRKIDALCAKNAGIKSIFYNSSNIKMEKFDCDFEIKDLFYINKFIPDIK